MYYVELLDNETGQVDRLGEFEERELAVAAAKNTIDEFLRDNYYAGMSATYLYNLYAKKGKTPVIFQAGSETVNVVFNPLTYAEMRTAELWRADGAGDVS